MKDEFVGKLVPKITLESSAGGSVTIPESWKGKWIVLYFYPKDDTPGCTKQACSYRDNIEDFKKIGVQVYGVSLDDLKSHDKFISKYNLNFPLLADVDHKLSESLGVYGNQGFMGKIFKGLSRDTFLIDPEGMIREVWRKVKADQTMVETLDAVRGYIKTA